MYSIFPPCPGLDSWRCADGVYRADAGVVSRISNWPRREFPHRALQAGATSLMEPTDQFYGDRSAGVQDQVGNQWWIATHQEDVPPEEIAKRAAACMQQHQAEHAGMT
jgi:hypothetical protein